MSAKELVGRLVAAEHGKSSFDLKKGVHDSEWPKLQISASKVMNDGLVIIDRGTMSIPRLRTLAKREKHKNGLDLIVIDYIQLMQGVGGNREQEISYISRSLKQISKELDVPVIALSQLSRGVESRTNKRPMLNDLRESGAIEQDADIVMFIYRDEYYGIMHDEQGHSTANRAEVNFAKHRGGSLATIDMQFKGETTEFTDLESFQEPLPYNPHLSSLSPADKEFDDNFRDVSGDIPF
jgi:replicative DNA helicase